MLGVFSKLICRIFFRRISLSGTPYLGDSAIWAANHQSGIVDPLVVTSVATVPLRPIAKHSLWSNPVLRFILGTTRAIPVFRVQDVSEKKESVSGNSEAFRAAAEALQAGDRILIFPEGISHDSPNLQKLKTGVARMALSALAQKSHSDLKVMLQPVAIDYFEKDEYRSDLAIHFCDPIAVTDRNTPVEDLMTALEDSLRAGHAEFSSWDEKRNWLFIFLVAHGRTPDGARELRDFVETYRVDLSENLVLLARVQTMRRMLLGMNITPDQIQWGEKHERKRSYLNLILTRGLFYFLVAAPIARLSSLIWFVPEQLTRMLANVSTRERDVVATMKIAHGLYLFPIWIALLSLSVQMLLARLWPEQTMLSYAIAFSLAPVILVLRLWTMERHEFFPGYWRLAKLRLFFPRGWREVITEWREIREAIQSRVLSPE